MRKPNAQIMRLLEESHPATFAAHQIVRRTGLSFSTVRATLNLAYDLGYVERDLGAGLGGHTIYLWYYKGGLAPHLAAEHQP